MHCSCPHCGSSDANFDYGDHQFCFACKTYTHGDGTPTKTKPMSNMIPLDQQVFQDLMKSRSLSEETCKKWRYGCGTYNGKPCQVANYLDDSGTLVAQKVRFADKSFIVLGDGKNMPLYGQWLWRDGGKMIVITEGEIDALSVAQVENSKWPVVSIPKGAAAAKKELAKHIEWLEKFESVILMFDNDEPGREAANECSELFTPGKCKVATLQMKDANDLLKAGKGSLIVDAKWAAKVQRPDGVVAGTDLLDRLLNRTVVKSLPFPYEGLNARTEGARNELILLTSGSGMGKTEVVGQWYYDWMMNHGETLGLIHLEENVERTCDRLIGLHLKKRIHLKAVRDTVSQEEYTDAYRATVGNGRVFLYDHFGSTASDNLFAKIRYLAKGCGCTTIVLDHISIVVSSMEEDSDERKLIDKLMTTLATLTQSLNVRIILISHLKKPDGTPHEEGGRVTLDDLRGSGSLKQLSFTVIGLERNQQDAIKKHWTRVRVLKCRHTGDTGHACWLQYDPETGWLNEGTPPFDDEEASHPFTVEEPTTASSSQGKEDHPF